MAVKDIGKTKKCEYCGKKFTVGAHNQIYCSIECRAKMQNKVQRIYKGIANKPIKKRAPKGQGKKRVHKKHRLLFGLYKR